MAKVDENKPNSDFSVRLCWHACVRHTPLMVEPNFYVIVRFVTHTPPWWLSQIFMSESDLLDSVTHPLIVEPNFYVRARFARECYTPLDGLSLIHILRAHETPEHLVCRLLLEKKKHTIRPVMNPVLTLWNQFINHKLLLTIGSCWLQIYTQTLGKRDSHK